MADRIPKVDTITRCFGVRITTPGTTQENTAMQREGNIISPSRHKTQKLRGPINGNDEDRTMETQSGIYGVPELQGDWPHVFVAVEGADPLFTVQMEGSTA